MTYIRPFRPNYGTGADGQITLSGNVSKQVYNLADGSAISGLILSSSYIPSIIRCNGTLTISGSIDGSGKGHAGGGGGVTGSGGYGYGGGGPGKGYGGGVGYDNCGGGGGGGGGHATAGGSGGTYRTYLPSGNGGSAYDALGSVLSGVYGEWCAGSGGGGGGACYGINGVAGGAGGGGIVIEARQVIVGSSASINLNGVNGNSQPDPTNGGGGGGGAGGLLIILAETITMPASGTIITAIGGSGGSAPGNPGGAGANGRIYLCYLRSISPSDAASRSNPTATVINLAALPVGIG